MTVVNAYYASELKKYLATYPEASTEFHYPGQNFTGPGTHVVTRLLNNSLPVNKTDFVTMLHDVEYMTDVKPYKSDVRAISNSDFSLAGLTTKLGLTTRTIIDALPFTNFKFNTPSKAGKDLMMYVLSSPTYRPLFSKYNISIPQYLN